MWRQWFKKTTATLVIADDGIVLGENNRDQTLFAKQPTMQTVESSMRQHQAKLKGKQLRLILAGTWSRVMVLPWQEKVCRREDWEALGQQALQNNCNDTAKWCCRVMLSGYGKPVYLIGMQQALHDLLMAMASELGFDWLEIKPLNTVLLQQNVDADKLVIVEPGFISIMQLASGDLSGVQLLKPPTGQEVEGLQQHLAREQVVSRANQQAKTKVLVSSVVNQDWTALEKAHINLTVLKSRVPSTSHAHWVAQQGVS